jgi:hypothetical protein
MHATDATRAQGRRIANSMKGIGARVASHLPSRGTDASPAVLHQRVRSHLGRAVSHPKAVHVDVRDDHCVCLTGHILQDELENLISAVENVPGVSRVDNQLMVHETAGNIPELQGTSRRMRAYGSGRSRWWGALAILAPVAIMAATLRASPRRSLQLAMRRSLGLSLQRSLGQPLRRSMKLLPRRQNLLQRLASDAEALPALIRRSRRRGYFSALRFS